MITSVRFCLSYDSFLLYIIVFSSRIIIENFYNICSRIIIIIIFF